MVKLSSPKSSGVEGLTPQTADGWDSASPVPLQPLLPPSPTLSPSIHHSALIGGGRRPQLGQCQTDGTQSDTRPLEVMPWLRPSLPPSLSSSPSAGGCGLFTTCWWNSNTPQTTALGIHLLNQSSPYRKWFDCDFRPVLGSREPRNFVVDPNSPRLWGELKEKGLWTKLNSFTPDGLFGFVLRCSSKPLGAWLTGSDISQCSSSNSRAINL